MTNWAGRGNRHERGYGNAWDKLRLQILRRDCYLCRCSECQPIGAPFPTRIRPATEVAITEFRRRAEAATIRATWPLSENTSRSGRQGRTDGPSGGDRVRQHFCPKYRCVVSRY